ncbi:unnamed protein product [Didymodactylos carnosus]|uniref:Uncharacterized protein n=1 Tax=Didymodactylos carnosus TaxID=1234261 RepID=A0A814NMB2_9BILA|nr:unnamed protein product [Didymodactylos carnosus]CAF3859342.1 unnamed protein product [Didymodactylos carnosus]
MNNDSKVDYFKSQSVNDAENNKLDKKKKQNYNADSLENLDFQSCDRYNTDDENNIITKEKKQQLLTKLEQQPQTEVPATHITSLKKSKVVTKVNNLSDENARNILGKRPSSKKLYYHA